MFSFTPSLSGYSFYVSFRKTQSCKLNTSQDVFIRKHGGMLCNFQKPMRASTHFHADLHTELRLNSSSERLKHCGISSRPVTNFCAKLPFANSLNSERL